MGDKVNSDTLGTWDINLRVGEVRMTLTIPRSPDMEQALRKATEQVNSTLERYRVNMPHASYIDLMSYVALDMANKLQTLRIEGEKLKIEERLSHLNHSLEEAL